MKNFFVLLFTLIMTSATAQQYQQIESKVHNWNGSALKKNGNRISRPILEGSTMDLKYFEMHATTLLPGDKPKPLHSNADSEDIIIVKEGKVKLSVGKESKILGPGSMMHVMPGEDHGIDNLGDVPATYVVLVMKSRKDPNPARGNKAGGSSLMDYDDIKFKPHAKGGVRNYFNRESTMCEYFEMHRTTLNSGIKSHEPHTHRAAEVIIMVDGNTEMEIDGKFYQGNSGDVYFMESNVPHAIENIGTEPCNYYAIQWY